jgi:Ni/Co efflux regulator RcnB
MKKQRFTSWNYRILPVRSVECNNTEQSAGNWDTTDGNDKPHTSGLETTSRKRNQKAKRESTTRKKKKKRHHDDNHHHKNGARLAVGGTGC